MLSGHQWSRRRSRLGLGHGVLRALIIDMEQNCPKTLLISCYQGKMVC
jgi:hypothetical protein